MWAHWLEPWRIWSLWPRTADYVSNERQSGSDNLSQSGIDVAEASYFQSVSLSGSVREPDASSQESDEARKLALRQRAKSWSGGDSLAETEIEAGFSELLKRMRNFDISTTSAETEHSLKHYKSDNKVQVLDPPIPADRAENLAAILGDPQVNGDEARWSERERSYIRGKEAKLESLRWRNLKSRATVAEMRQELAEARLEMSSADDRFMRLVREKRMQQPDGKFENFLLLDEQYSQLQATRDRYGLLEESYNTREEQLDREEYEVTQLEEQLQDIKNSQHLQFDGSDGLSRASYNDEPDGLALVEDKQYSLYDEYLSRQGDADLIHEELHELRFEHNKLHEARNTRQRVGLELSPEDQSILDNFSTEEATLLEELQVIEADVELLRTRCALAGLLDEAEDGKEGEEENREESEDEDEETVILRRSDKSVISEFRALLLASEI